MENDQRLKMLGQKIRQKREELNLTQDQMAHNAGFARSYYSGVERGVRNISAVNLIRLATAMNVEVGELFPTLKKLK
jgi:transcriptional regulator with XRE-family HTH domain